MKKPAAEDKVIRDVLDYVKASHWINEILGFDQRDAHSNFKPELPHVDPARDREYPDRYEIWMTW